MKICKLKEQKIERIRIIGFILLVPHLLGVLFFVINVFGSSWEVAKLYHLSSEWTGSYREGGYMSAAPVYLGLMAIAGAYLIKGTSNK